MKEVPSNTEAHKRPRSCLLHEKGEGEGKREGRRKDARMENVRRSRLRPSNGRSMAKATGFDRMQDAPGECGRLLCN